MASTENPSRGFSFAETRAARGQPGQRFFKDLWRALTNEHVQGVSGLPPEQTVEIKMLARELRRTPGGLYLG